MHAWHWLIERYRTRRVWRWAIDAVAFSLIALAIGAWQTRHLPQGLLPNVPLRTLAGMPTSTAAWAGKPVLVEVWAPWCGVCRWQADNLSRVRRWLGDHTQVVSIATAYRDEADVRAAIASHGIDYPVYLADEAAMQALQVSVFPTMFVLDAAGRVEHSVAGYTTTLGLYLRARW
jgi:thiol-disulfide isomerase/thioredoxin